MPQLTRRPREEGFTLIELLITTTILGVIIFGLAGTVIRFLQDSADTQGRFSESHDVQFAAAYWQRDVSSIGVRSSTYTADPNNPDVFTYPLVQSVNVTPACSLPSGTVVGTLAWSELNSTVSNATPDLVTVTYLSSGSGSGPYTLTRVRCNGSTVASTVKLSSILSAAPVMACSGPAGSSCTGAGSNVPTLITLTLTSEDRTKRHSGSYSATLTGERRQT